MYSGMDDSDDDRGQGPGFACALCPNGWSTVHCTASVGARSEELDGCTWAGPTATSSSRCRTLASLSVRALAFGRFCVHCPCRARQGKVDAFCRPRATDCTTLLNIVLARCHTALDVVIVFKNAVTVLRGDPINGACSSSCTGLERGVRDGHSDLGSASTEHDSILLPVLVFTVATAASLLVTTVLIVRIVARDNNTFQLWARDNARVAAAAIVVGGLSGTVGSFGELLWAPKNPRRSRTRRRVRHGRWGTTVAMLEDMPQLACSLIIASHNHLT